MKRFLTILLVGGGLLGALSGCNKQNVYRVQAAHHETVRDELDARWFKREIHDKQGLSAIELVYCPVLPDAPTTCRTAVVWSRDRSRLIENARWGGGG